MFNKYKIALLLVSVLNFSCNSQSGQNGLNNTNIFSAKMFGWTMTIPDNWEIIQKNEIESQKQRGLELMDKSTLTELQKQALQKQLSKSIYLLGFKKSKRKMFTAIAEAFDPSAITFEKHNINTKEVLCKTLQKQGIKIDTTWGHELISHKEFKTFKVVSTKNNQIISQIYFNRQIDNYMLSIILLYDDKETKDILLTHLRNSKFEK